MAETATLDAVAAQVAALLGGSDVTLRDPTGSDLVFDGDAIPRPLPSADPPVDCWAVDGGQALLADARCLQVVVARAATVRFRHARTEIEDPGTITAHLLGIDPGIDLNLLRDRAEWDAVALAVDAAEPGALVLVDGDLVPDWRAPASLVPDLIATAQARQVTLVAVTKHSSLARGRAPLVGVLERAAEATLGPRTTWWAPIANLGDGKIEVVVARLDPDARFAFRIDLAGHQAHDPAAVLGQLAAVSDDAAFPGYPYPLSVADRVAACPGWLRHELRTQLDELLRAAGVDEDARERAFADRHRFLERGGAMA